MNPKEINKILAPLYVYIGSFIIFYLAIGKIQSKLWNDILFYIMLIGLPILVLIFINVQFVRISKKIKYFLAFLLSSLPGLVAGAWLGYGMYGVLFPTTFIGFTEALLFVGLFGAIIFGILGILINLGFVGFKKIFKPLK